MDERMIEIGAQGLHARMGWREPRWGALAPDTQQRFREIAGHIAIALLDAGYTILPPVEGQVK